MSIDVPPTPVPTEFRRWFRRQLLLALAVFVLLIGGLGARAAYRADNPIARRMPWHVWIKGTLAPGRSAFVDVALTAGGDTSRCDGWVWTFVHSSGEAAADGSAALSYTWSVANLTARVPKRLLGDEREDLGQFAWLGETRTVDGVVWQELCRGFYNGGYEAEPTEVDLAGLWAFEGDGDFVGNRRFSPNGRLLSATGDLQGGRWTSHDGVINLNYELDGPKKRSKPGVAVPATRPNFLVGRISDDRRAITGLDWLGRKFSARRID